MALNNNNNNNSNINNNSSNNSFSSHVTATTTTLMTPLPLLQTANTSSAKRQRCTTLSTHPPELPAYLQNTLYAALLREQQQKREQESQNKSKSNVREVPDLRLPSLWNRHDKSRHLEVENGGYDLVYTGPGKTENHAASIRSNFPIRRQCGIYYYEMKIISKGEDGFIGMGFCSGKNGLDRLPGWDNDSWGYHGDDGHSFEESGTGKTYGPRFSTGDVIGCGINMADKTAFYTKNGTYLGIAFRKLKTSMNLYPCVGLRTPGEHVTVNFGQDPFVFDIVHYVKERKNEIYTQVKEKKNKMDIGESMDRLVMSYLVYQGYMSTAKAALNDIKHASGRTLQLSHSGTSKVDDKEEEDMFKRQNIRSAILQGNIDTAIELAKSYFPECMEQENLNTHDIMFELKARKFVEMVREYSLYVHEKPLRSATSSSSLSSSDDNDDDDGDVQLNDADDDQEDQAMDIDDDEENQQRQEITRKKRNRQSQSSNESNGFMDSGLVLSDEEAARDVLLDSIMEYGQRLKYEYRNDKRPEVEERLKEIFSLLAYADPGTSRMAYLMDLANREALATKLNSVMLALQHRPEEPPLERLYRQTVTTNRQLAYMGHGKSLLLPDLTDSQWFT